MEKSAYRIIDANFNRAREALRVMEEYCRFCLDNSDLTGRAKAIRHELCGQIRKLDTGELICSRDTEGDVGVGKQVEAQLGRGSLVDSFTAAAKRLEEALRALAEVIKIIDADSARIIEDLRYRTYTLEKDVVVYSSTSLRISRVKLYVLITSSDSNEILSLTRACGMGGADCVQLRVKNSTDRDTLELGKEFVHCCGENDLVSIINDRVDIAVLSGADGVHLGQDDIGVDAVGDFQRKPMIVGKSTHNIAQLECAISESPGYIALGPAYQTKTKPGVKAAGMDYIYEGVRRLKQAKIPSLAIGGIDEGNIQEVLASGVDIIAVCSAVTGAEDPQGACERLKEKILNF